MSDENDNGPEVPTRPRSRRRDARQIAGAVTKLIEENEPEDPYRLPAATANAAAEMRERMATPVEDEESWDVQAAREHRELYAELTPRRRERARIPQRFHGLDFPDTEADERARAISTAAAWADGGGPRGLLLWGPVGRGKTRLAATAAWHRCAIGPVVWRNVAELLMALSYAFDHPERERALSDLRGIGDAALVLDDLDKTKPTDHALQPLYLAINGWVEAQRPLLVTSNRPLAELATDFGDRFGAPIASRLAGYCAEFEVEGRDRRLEP